MPRSKFDELHDKYFSILTNKSGTRYERLAALVFKSLHESGIVIHDLKLVGDTGVQHQIDVVVETDSVQRRILIEHTYQDSKVSVVKVGGKW